MPILSFLQVLSRWLALTLLHYNALIKGWGGGGGGGGGGGRGGISPGFYEQNPRQLSWKTKGK